MAINDLVDSNGVRLCGAELDGGARICHARAMPNGRCYHHGGNTPKGIDHPNHKDFIRGQLPSNIYGRYLQAERDPDLLSLNHEIRILDIFLADVLGKMAIAPASDLWRDLQSAWRDLIDANRLKDPKASTAAAATMTALIDRGVEDAAARSEAMRVMDQRRKLVESEGKRRIAMEQSVSAQEVMLLTSAIEQIVLRYVDNPSQRAAVSAEFAKLATFHA